MNAPEGFVLDDESISPPEGFEIDEPKSLGGFAKNIGHDIKDTVSGVGHLAEGLIKNPVDTSMGFLTGFGPALFNEGKRLGAGELLTGHPINAVEKFGNAFYEKPITTALDVAPAGEALSKFLGVGGKAAKGAELASEAAPLAEEAPVIAKSAIPATEEASRVAPSAPEALNIGDEAADILKKAPEPPVQPPEPPPGNLASKVKEVIPKEVIDPLNQVKDYVSKKYGQISQKPGWANTVADYLKEHGQNMNLKDMGASGGQIRKIGVDRARQLADYAAENKLVGPEVGTIGREKLIPQRLEEAGGAVGAFRKIASDRGAVHNVDDLINQVKSKLDQKYMTPGMYSGQKGMYLKGLMELKKAGATTEEMANKVSEMFQESRNLDPLRRPSGPLADIARQVRNANHDLIAKYLSPEELSTYEHGLEDYGALKQINEFVKRRSSTDAGGRLGPGSGISRAAVQKFLDSVGYRTEGRVASKLSDIIRRNPEIASRPKDIFRNYIDEAANAIDDMGEAAQ